MELKETQKNWDELGATDPLYGVLSHDGKSGSRWEEAEFFATGREEIDALLRQADARGYGLVKGRALDFGCGVGRLSQALAGHFEAVVGLDIAPSMLERAKAYNRVGARCEYLLNEAPDLKLFPDASFDFVYSHIVLQHMAARYALAYVSEFVRVLKPEGLLVFQVPERAQYSTLRLAMKAFLPKRLLFLSPPPLWCDAVPGTRDRNEWHSGF